ncbi:hypothetical protein IEO21_01173 [Rhodonia placenta]|uniref:Amine oxidase domain-containing protein n=1 Tax=Rhodonia placenta TaxID=104341 RepID=A0A8H7PA11_9APHY|nr:hypothetical protein IEO21_01173 [Postia placenta]
MKVAVVGSGVSGLAATWLLNEYSDHEVHLYEADCRPGGHANTVTFSQSGREPVEVDTYIVFNPSTYPNFLRFLNLYPDLRQHICATDMTFSVSRDGGAFEWAGNNLSSVFCQPKRLLDPDMWRMLYDIPMTAAIWSTPPDKCTLDFPARTLIQFMHNHHLLQIFGKPSWLTLRGGSLERGCIITSVPALDGHGDHNVELVTALGERIHYDRIIVAAHSDAALSILRAGGGATADEERILGEFEWNKNVAVLHCDKRLMPKRRVAWSCWNYLTRSTVDKSGNAKANVDQVSLPRAYQNLPFTDWMNELQHISEETYGPVLVTLNPPFDPDPETLGGRYEYDHPVLGMKAVRAQQELSTIQNKRGISFVGAWTKYGFHEDGFTSGLRAASVIMHESSTGATKGMTCEMRMPFEILDADHTVRHETQLAALLFDVFEGTGLRLIVGTCLSLCLGVFGCLVNAVGACLAKPA